GLQAPLLGGRLAGRAAADDASLEIVAPAVVRALERRTGDARVLLEDPRAAMPAGVMKGRDRAVVAPQDEDRPGTDLKGAVIAPFGNLGLRGHEQPVTPEDVLELGPIECVVTEECAREGESRLEAREQCGDVPAQRLRRRSGRPRRAAGGGNGCGGAHGVKFPQTLRGSRPRICIAPSKKEASEPLGP